MPRVNRPLRLTVVAHNGLGRNTALDVVPTDGQTADTFSPSKKSGVMLADAGIIRPTKVQTRRLGHATCFNETMGVRLHRAMRLPTNTVPLETPQTSFRPS